MSRYTYTRMRCICGRILGANVIRQHRKSCVAWRDYARAAARRSTWAKRAPR